MKSTRRSGAPYYAAMRLCPHARDLEFQLPLELAAPRGKERVLDFPAGSGYLRPYLEAIAPETELHSVEHVPDYQAMDGETILQGDWENLPFADGEIDVILCIAAAHHVMPDRTPFYEEAARVLASGGRLVVADVEQGTPPALFLEEFVKEYSAPGHEALFFSKSQERAWIEAAGLRLTHYENLKYHWHLPDRATAIRYCRGIFRLDRGTDEDIWAGLHRYLGIERSNGALRLNWQLSLLRADR